MNNETKQLLTRWQLLQKEQGLQRAGAVARSLWFIGLALCIFVVFGVVYSLQNKSELSADQVMKIVGSL